VLGIHEMLPHGKLYELLAKEFCNKEIPDYLCENFLFLIAGYDEKQMNAVSN